MIKLKQTITKTKIKSIVWFEPDMTHEWVLIQKDHETIGLFELQELTKITRIIHMHLKSEHQNQGLAIKCLQPLKDYCKLHNIHSILAPIAESNLKMLKVINKTDFKPIGVLKTSIISNNQIENLNLFQLEVM